MCVRGSAEYADVTCLRYAGLCGCLLADATCGLHFICIDRLDAPSSASSGCAGCSRSKPAAADGGTTRLCQRQSCAH